MHLNIAPQTTRSHSQSLAFNRKAAQGVTLALLLAMAGPGFSQANAADADNAEVQTETSMASGDLASMDNAALQKAIGEQSKRFSALVSDFGVHRENALNDAQKQEAQAALVGLFDLYKEWAKRNPAGNPLMEAILRLYATHHALLGGDLGAANLPQAVVKDARFAARFAMATQADQTAAAEKWMAALEQDFKDETAYGQLQNASMLRGAIDPALAKRMSKAMSEARLAKAHAKEIEDSKDMIAMAVGKPMTLKGTLADGTTFSTDAWKGKVVIVDFWATWCMPCVASIPELRDLYDTHHAQGLEIIGVSNDRQAEQVLAFEKSNEHIAWPSFFETPKDGQPIWHPIAAKYGIQSIPKLFVIDRNGTCRSVTARHELDTLIPKLLAEPAGE